MAKKNHIRKSKRMHSDNTHSSTIVFYFFAYIFSSIFPFRFAFTLFQHCYFYFSHTKKQQNRMKFINMLIYGTFETIFMVLVLASSSPLSQSIVCWFLFIFAHAFVYRRVCMCVFIVANARGRAH